MPRTVAAIFAVAALLARWFSYSISSLRLRRETDTPSLLTDAALSASAASWSAGSAIPAVCGMRQRLRRCHLLHVAWRSNYCSENFPNLVRTFITRSPVVLILPHFGQIRSRVMNPSVFTVRVTLGNVALHSPHFKPGSRKSATLSPPR